jgi:UDP-N-acetylglucosamine 1-carboxyvinyltransferase
MDRIRIVGGRRLNGTIPISGAKNATLPLMIASLLTDQTLILDNVPRLADVALLERILGNHGVDIMVSGKRAGETADHGQTLHISAANIVDTTAPYDLVSKMRASFWVLAPLLARSGEARVSLPGGCAIGTRPVDLLIMAMERLGARIDIDSGYVVARAPRGLKGAEIVFPKVTVGGTHTAIMAASLAAGTTVIENAAREPEIADVADCLNKMGARISGAGTGRIVVEGVAKLNGARHAVLPDRIETGTYAMAVAMTGGDILLQNARPELLQAALDVLQQTGTTVTPTNQGIRIARNGGHLAPVEVTTAPFPAHGADDARARHLAHHRDRVREPLHACAGAGTARRPHPARRRAGHYRRRRAAQRRAGDGNRFARLGLARHRGACRRGRDRRQPRLSSRPRLRAARRQAWPVRRRH